MNESIGMFTDQYELTMLEASRKSYIGQKQCVFEVFGRSLRGRRYGVVAGTSRVIDAVTNFGFDTQDIKWLLNKKIINESTAGWLADYKFKGDIVGYSEGEIYYPFSPILTIKGTFEETVILETLILSILNYDTAVATTASRIRSASGNKTLIEMASRRTNEHAAVATSRAAYLAGFNVTSNLRAGQLYDIPTTGTAAHAFTMAHNTEEEAFSAQVQAFGPGTTLLVDTYNIATGIENALAVSGYRLGGIRIDSGDLASEAKKARRELNAMGANNTKIILSGDLDEFQIKQIIAANTPVDAFGVGTKLINSLSSPGLVYKLVAIEKNNIMSPVSKSCLGKSTIGGEKYAFRTYDNGVVNGEKLSLNYDENIGYPLQKTFINRGVVVKNPTLEVSRKYHETVINQLPLAGKDIDDKNPFLVAELVYIDKNKHKGNKNSMEYLS